VPWATLLKLAVAVLAGWMCVRLWPAGRLVVFAGLIAMALSPIVRFLERRGLGRGKAVVVLALGTLVLGAVAAVLIVPALAEQISDLWKSLPAMRGRIGRYVGSGTLVGRILLPLFDLPRSPEVDAWLAQPLVWGPPTFALAGGIIVVVVLSFYLLLDGPKVVAWLLAYAPRAERRRVGEMVPELFSVVQGYVTGQLIVSSLFAAFSGTVLVVCGVPGALPLAVLAALCDVVPVAGITAITILAFLSALTVSPTTALLVGSLFVAYHLFEFYVLVPRLYGNRLQLSTLTVLLAVIGGGVLGGVPGIVLALPLVAAYPVVERYWLEDWLHPDAVADHSALREVEDGKEKEELVNAVLEGQPLDRTR
jgi:predicted PurR-regulated permease PerM